MVGSCRSLSGHARCVLWNSYEFPAIAGHFDRLPFAATRGFLCAVSSGELCVRLAVTPCAAQVNSLVPRFLATASGRSDRRARFAEAYPTGVAKRSVSGQVRNGKRDCGAGQMRALREKKPRQTRGAGGARGTKMPPAPYPRVSFEGSFTENREILAGGRRSTFPHGQVESEPNRLT
jgi:hypothetical protein